jgi:hypothetical protein
MPTWGEEQGGPLNDEQVVQLATFINRGDEWDAAAEFAREQDDTGVKLTQAVSAEDATLQVTDASTFAANGVILIDEERMTVHEVQESALTVERGSRASEAAPHEEGAELFNQPVPPDPPAIVQQACGQFNRAPAPTTAPTEAATEAPTTPGAATPTPEATVTVEAPSGEAQVVEISAVPTMRFDKSEIRVKAGGQVTVRFTNVIRAYPTTGRSTPTTAAARPSSAPTRTSAPAPAKWRSPSMRRPPASTSSAATFTPQP